MKSGKLNYFVHDSAVVHQDANIGMGTRIWDWVKIRENATVGENCILGQSVYVDINVTIGSRCKIQNGVSVYQGVSLGDDVFVGPNATFTNDRAPRAFSENWQIIPTIVEEGASIGANATIICGVTLGRYCMIAAGAVVTKSIPPFGLVMGNPGRVVDYVDEAGNRLRNGDRSKPSGGGTSR